MAAQTSIFSVMTALAAETGALNLGQGFPDTDGPASVVDAAVDALRAGHNQYAPPLGVPALREAIAAHQQARYGLTLDPAREVQVTFGATEAVAAALLALAPGVGVAVLDPVYDAYGPIVARAGGTLQPITLEPPHWRVTAEAIDAAITPATRVLLLNTPHNPTGRVLTREELELLAAACRRHDLIAITDEVYEHLVFEGEHLPLATLPGMAERTLTISSLGKTFGLTGWKVGWAAGPAELIEAVHAVKQFLTFSGGTPLQHAAAAALALPPAELEAARAELHGKRDRLAGALADAGLQSLPCEGTYFLNVNLAAQAAPDEDGAALCQRLVREAGVALIPLGVFRTAPDEATRSIVRLAFCKRDEVLDEAARRIAAWAAPEREAL